MATVPPPPPLIRESAFPKMYDSTIRRNMFKGLSLLDENENSFNDIMPNDFAVDNHVNGIASSIINMILCQMILPLVIMLMILDAIWQCLQFRVDK